MNEVKLTFRQMLERLQADGFLTAQKFAEAEGALSNRENNTPIFVGILIGVGAWLAGCFFTAFLLLLFDTMHVDKGGVFLAGCGYLFGATLLRRSSRHLFFIQAALALAVAGYLMAVFGVVETASYGERELWAALASTLLAVVVCYFNPCPIIRFIMPVVATGIVLNWLVTAQMPWAVSILVLAQISALTTLLLRYRAVPGLRVLAHALIVGLAMTLGTLLHQEEYTGWYSLFYYHHSTAEAHAWQDVGYLLTLVLALWLMWAVRWFARRVLPAAAREEWHRHPVVRAAILACVLLAAVSNTGVLAFTGILLLGYGLQERRIAAGATILMYCSLVYVFVEMHNLFPGQIRTPAALIASGLVFLFVRVWLRRWSSRNIVLQPVEVLEVGGLSKWQNRLLWGGAAFLFLVLNAMAMK